MQYTNGILWLWWYIKRNASVVCSGKLWHICLQERDKVMPLIIQGFKDASEEAGTSVTGGQTVVNPWIVLGGVATTVCQPNEFIM